MDFPRLFHVRQTLGGPSIDRIEHTVFEQLKSLRLEATVKPDQTVAVTAGSRGISNIATIVKAICDFVKRELRAQPMVVPAMGSHGGATAEGQLDVLATYGINEAFLECPIRSSMETVKVCESPEGVEVHFDRNAFDADHVIVCNRIKLHTDFQGVIQSGLMKMMLIGLGKHRGASIYHRAFRDYSFDQIARSVSDQVIRECRVIGGLAIVENGHEQTALIEAIPPHSISSREPELLQLSSQWMARIPFDLLDILIVDEIGKNLSGTGMDTNVVGRKTDENRARGDEVPKIKKIFVRDLTEETHGNGTGIGAADFTVQRVIDKLDYAAMRVNCVTSGRTGVGKIPIYYPTDREAVQACLQTIGLAPPFKARLVRIKNTLELGELVCSEALLDAVDRHPDLEQTSELFDMAFDDAGTLS